MLTTKVLPFSLNLLIDFLSTLNKCVGNRIQLRALYYAIGVWENSHKMDPYFAADLHRMISEIASDIFNSQVGANIT